MNISRVATFSLAMAVAVFALGHANSSFAAPPEKVETKCSDGRDNDRDGKIDGEDEDCASGGGGGSGDTVPTIEYTAELTGAFEFGPVIVTLYHNGLTSANNVTIDRPANNEAGHLDTWNEVFDMFDLDLGRFCHLFEHDEAGNTIFASFIAKADRKKGWAVYRGPGTTQVSFTGIELISDTHCEGVVVDDVCTDEHTGLGDLDLALILTGKCPLDGDDLCEAFPPDPMGAENSPVTSEAEVSTYWIHARGDGNATHQGEACHSGIGDLPISTLKITAIICPNGEHLQETPTTLPTCTQI